MTAAEVIREIRRVGGIRLAQGHVQVMQCPRELKELARRFEESIRTILAQEKLRTVRQPAAVRQAFAHVSRLGTAGRFVGYGFDKFLAALETGPVLQRLISVPEAHLKVVSLSRLKEIENGRAWRPPSASNLEPTNSSHWNGSRYRWQRVCHSGACDHAIETPGRARVCSRCYPFANGGGGRLVRVTGRCAASRHAVVKRKVDDSWAFFAEHMLWVRDQETQSRSDGDPWAWQRSGPLCPGCRGLWPSLEALAAHMPDCATFGLNAIAAAEARIENGLATDDKLGALYQRYRELGLGPVRGLKNRHGPGERHSGRGESMTREL